MRERATRSRLSNCNAKLDITWRSAVSILPEHAWLATVRCEASGTMEPHSSEWRPSRKGRSRLPASRRSGTRVERHGQHKWIAASVVNKHKPKMLTGLRQKASDQEPW